MSHGAHCLHVAVAKGLVALAQLLVRRTLRPYPACEYSCPSSRLAYIGQTVRVVDGAQVQHGAELDCIAPRLGAPLHLAAKKNHAVHWLAPANRDCSYRLLRLLFVPAYYDYSCRLLGLFVPFAVQVMAEFLLSVGSDANLLWEGESALLIAARYRSAPCLRAARVGAGSVVLSCDT
jgi:hypothetical protein